MTNPTIMRLNKIFNNLFDKKQKKTTKKLTSVDENGLNFDDNLERKI